jgi:hypothetical protein
MIIQSVQFFELICSYDSGWFSRCVFSWRASKGVSKKCWRERTAQFEGTQYLKPFANSQLECFIILQDSAFNLGVRITGSELEMLGFEFSFDKKYENTTCS